MRSRTLERPSPFRSTPVAEDDPQPGRAGTPHRSPPGRRSAAPFVSVTERPRRPPAAGNPQPRPRADPTPYGRRSGAEGRCGTGGPSRRTRPRPLPPPTQPPPPPLPPFLPSVLPRPPPHPSPHSVSPVVPTASCREMASSGASPRRRAAAGPRCAASSPERGARGAAEEGRRGRGQTRLTASPAPAQPLAIFVSRGGEAGALWEHKEPRPRPGGPRLRRQAAPRPGGGGSGAAAEGHRWNQTFAAGEQRRTTLGSRSERYRCPQPGLVAAVPGLALRRRRPPIVPRHPGAAVRDGRCGAGFLRRGARARGERSTRGRSRAQPGGGARRVRPLSGPAPRCPWHRDAALGAAAPRRAAILGAEPNCSSCWCGWNGRLERAASSSRSACGGARAGQP